MSRHEITFTYATYAGMDGLPEQDRELVSMAISTCDKAYAPYSDFRVGVAIRTVENNIVTGSNQENASYPIGQCAERVALYRMTHELGRREIGSIAIAVDNEQQRGPATPCGSCRQMLAEYRSYQSTPIRLLLVNKRHPDVIEIGDVTDLLPMAFDGKFLGY
jgi:cytidine deaminase